MASNGDDEVSAESSFGRVEEGEEAGVSNAGEVAAAGAAAAPGIAAGVALGVRAGESGSGAGVEAGDAAAAASSSAPSMFRATSNAMTAAASAVDGGVVASQGIVDNGLRAARSVEGSVLAKHRAASNAVAIQAQLLFGGSDLRTAAQTRLQEGVDGAAVVRDAAVLEVASSAAFFGAVADVGGEAAEGAADAAERGVSSVIRALPGAWGDVPPIFRLSSAELTIAMAVASGLAVQLWSLVKLEIVRDVQQVLALIFASISTRAMELASVFFGRIASIISLDFTEVIPSIPPTVTFTILAVCGIILFLLFIVTALIALGIQPDEIRNGHEAKTFDKQKEESGWMLIAVQYSLVIAMSLYLPISRSVVQILACDASMARTLENLGVVPVKMCTKIGQDLYECDCKLWDGYTFFEIAAYVLLIGFIIALPILVGWLVVNNLPVGSREDPKRRFDSAGRLVPYTNAMYLQDLQTDPRQTSNPWLFLYRDFERHSAGYRVVVMILKLLLIIPVIVLKDHVIAQVSTTLVLLGIFSILSWWFAPFINDQADLMDLSGRITCLTTALFGFLGSDQVVANGAVPFAIVINIVNAINLLLLILLLLYSLKAVRSFLKNLSGQFSFSDTARMTEGRPQTIIPEWDVFGEVSRRAWESFWQALLLREEKSAKRALEEARNDIKEGMSPADAVAKAMKADTKEEEEKDAAAVADESEPQKGEEEVRKNDGSNGGDGGKGVREVLPAEVEAALQPLIEREQRAVGMMKRLSHLRRRAMEVGVHRMREHFESLEDPAVADLYDNIQHKLEGTDVFWDGSEKAGDSESKFAKMWVQVVPFTCVIVWDDSRNYEFLVGKDAVQKLWNRNRDPEVLRRRMVRRELRALNGARVHLHCQETVSKSVEDGTYKDSKGNSHTRYSTVSVVMTFNYGVLTIAANTDREMSAGFKVSITFHDGTGSARAPHTGKMHHFSNESITLGHDKLNIDPRDFVKRGRLLQLLEDGENIATIATRMPAVNAMFSDYRSKLIQKRADDEALLSSGFLSHIYEAVGTPRPLIESYLTHFETNPFLKSIPTTAKSSLDFLYKRLDLIFRHPVSAFWWVFWSDLWSSNQELSVLKEKQDLLDPLKPTALCYTPMPRDKLVEKVKQDAPELLSSFFYLHPALLDLLYSEMDKRVTEASSPPPTLPPPTPKEKE